MRILLVEDEQKTGDYLKQGLSEAGYITDWVTDGLTGKHQALSEEYDLIILDVMLPGLDGWNIINDIRKSGKTMPILFLTARDQIEDRVKGLELGADDYLAKPFSARELLARVKALLRRNQIVQSPTAEARYLCFNGWKLDLLRRELINAQGVEEILSGIEFALLALFLRYPNQIFDRVQISEITRRRENNPLERGIDVQISRLRQRLHDTDRRLLRTVRNQGYMLCCDVSREY